MDSVIDTWFSFSDELLILFRILLSILLGFAIGFERELYKKSAGLRTHILVCVASCLVMLVSIYGFDSGDPARLASQAVSGIGFLGAGVILREDRGVTGITTAATIWMSAMIGLACGNGFYFGAILATVLALTILTFLVKVEYKISSIVKNKSTIVLKVKNDLTVYTKVNENLTKHSLCTDNVVYKNEYDEIEITIEFSKKSKSTQVEKFIQDLQKEVDIKEMKIENE